MSTQKYDIHSRAECEQMVKQWGFSHVFTWTDASNAHYSPHSHSGVTTHLIRRGTFTITYPKDNATQHNGEVKKETFGVGDRIDVPAGKVHEVWIGPEGYNLAELELPEAIILRLYSTYYSLRLVPLIFTKRGHLHWRHVKES
ncbi:hypothetical protein UA08_07280 [Talaromyces atroroseus]|uniref:Cupin 2 conserved barrel domain-containing protein n=1 Tax=Talaromyces atroroseus TaxID=1441469 RepID=A0A225AFC8_TALAT|nr:hypothetical protein UA08_07280 [Talaromyces atroroseus]OKL57823.1 hypothetical protein UA08_07280 [Talaromyces atroroseus]